MEQKEVLNDITHVTDHLYSSNLDADISKIKNAYDAKTNRGAETRACFENIGYEFACLFQAIEQYEVRIAELETKVSDLTDNIDSYASEDYVDEAIETHRDAEDQHLDDKIQDKLSEAKFHVQVVF
jgi:polyhydroxyalkanoate synthesis regulator phasin